MVITIIISLYTSRVVLQVLGVEDYGIYGIVGGVVIMMTFINSSMSGATSRFITFAIGENNRSKISDVFNTAIHIHILIALLLFVVAETIGLWFVSNKLIIPENRMFAAITVYHLSVLATVVSVIQTPFNATIIAYERMSVFAYIEILNTILKLLIVIILPYLPFDKLICYGTFFFIVNIIILSIYVVFTYNNFIVCRIAKLSNKEYYVPMLQYCLWDLFGSLSGTLKQQGTNIIINMFFGVLLNAASAIATQVQAAVSGLASNVIQAFRPQIIKSYSQNNIIQMQEYICNAIKYTLLMYSMCIIPLYVELDFVLKMWLEIVPEYALQFCRWLLVSSYFGLIVMILITSNHATGKIKYLSTATGIYNMLILPVTYISYEYFDVSPEMTYIISTGFVLLTLITDLVITKYLIPDLVLSKIVISILTPLSISLLVFLLVKVIPFYSSDSVSELLFVVLVSIISHLVITYYFVLSKETKVLIIKKIRKYV